MTCAKNQTKEHFIKIKDRSHYVRRYLLRNREATVP
jgi:hypothetical protein